MADRKEHAIKVSCVRMSAPHEELWFHHWYQMIIVCGIHRSGNSLLASALSSELDVKFIDDPTWAIQSKNLSAELPSRLTKISNGRKRTLVKVPRAVDHLHTLLMEVPTAQVATVVRDPFDVYLSYLDAILTGNLQPRSMIDLQGPGVDLFAEFECYYSSVAYRILSMRGSIVATSFSSLAAYTQSLRYPGSPKHYVGPEENKRVRMRQFGDRTMEGARLSCLKTRLQRSTAGKLYRELLTQTTDVEQIMSLFGDN